MNEVYQAILDFGALLVPEIVNVILLFIVVIILVLIGKLALAMSNHEDAKRIREIWFLVDDAIYNASLTLMGYSDEAGREIASDYAEQYGETIDPRLAWVIKQAELRVEGYVNYDFNFFEVMQKAEAIYQSRVKI